MAYRSSRTSNVRTSKPAQHQPTQHQQYQNPSRNFVSGGTVQPSNTPGVTYPKSAPAAPQPQTQPQPQRQPQTQPQPPQQQPPQPQKQEMHDRDGDVTMDTTIDVSSMDLEQLRAQKKKFFEGLKKVTGVRKKPNKQMVQRRLKKHLTPKNATMALQEVSPGASYQFSQMPGSSPPLFTAEVEVGGKKYHGVGGNKSLARAAAAERALQSFLRPPTTTKDAEGKETVEDSTPWSALAGFALHKLFCDWRQGKVGVPLSVETAGPSMDDASAAAAINASFKNDAPAADFFQSFTGPSKAKKNGEAKKDAKPKPAKQLPTDAAARHPVMLLHEMRPSAVYEVVNTVAAVGGHEPSCTVSVTVDEQTFSGTGRTKKLAKYSAAKSAMMAIFNVQYATGME